MPSSRKYDFLQPTKEIPRQVLMRPSQMLLDIMARANQMRNRDWLPVEFKSIKRAHLIQTLFQNKKRTLYGLEAKRRGKVVYLRPRNID